MDLSGALKSKGRTSMKKKRGTEKKSERGKKKTAKVSLRFIKMQIFHRTESD